VTAGCAVRTAQRRLSQKYFFEWIFHTVGYVGQ
jgi:hypothetical protein